MSNKYNVGDRVLNGMTWREITALTIRTDCVIYELDGKITAKEDAIFGSFEEVGAVMRQRVGAAYDKAIKAIESLETGVAKLVEDINEGVKR